ncbi:extracellular solute-binding protein [Gilvimarinus sp. 2_MG-2023]|uniref:extracellular solute-binding protein n=1 Tax=Gilvimarinus sp. 2_MG-2023 TaxID=3062666 RepID=UPI0026E26B92|nr:extracellular solute-binding protein [Gilvimarinus sp. 2_MG-2023]MDO6571730.1 extracellular solute-binding protein [Gilvimarinus sp. 2_MG-2023]
MQIFKAWGLGMLLIPLIGITGSMSHAESKAVTSSSESKSVSIIRSHAFAKRGEPKYGEGFKSFDYVNPEAPKGGQLVLSTTGTYDSFNRYASRGDSEINSEAFYDSLMVASEDEIGVYYSLIAQSLEYPDDYSWVIFHINHKAKHQDGEPITSEDVTFTFQKFMDEGVAFVRQKYAEVEEVVAIDEHTVKFSFSGPNKDLISSVASLPILPKQYWAERDFSEPLKEPPLGSGAYRVVDFKMGQSATYERITDYWAQDIPSRRGLMNFDRIRYDYYRDGTVALEAFKAGEFDFRQENVAKQWAEGYKVPAVKDGRIIKEELSHSIPQSMQAFVFNTQFELFQDRRVRQAINLMLDFEWLNKTLFYSSYSRNESYFENTPYKATGKPTDAELAILEPFRDQLPEEVFGPVWRPNKSDGSGRIRGAMREALSLLKQAGWELKNGILRNTENGTPFEFEILMYSPSTERITLPFTRNLERIGIKAELRMVDSTQFLNRMRSRDFEMLPQGYGAMPYPMTDMKIIWHSEYIESTYNQAGVQDPVIDALVEQIEANQENDEMLLALGRAFDRVALWNFYVVPQWHSDSFRIAYWNKFSRPDKRPKYSIGTDSWWYDNTKAKSLKK